MDKIGGMVFSAIFGMLGWAFAPFDSEPIAAVWVALIISIIGLTSFLYFAIYGEKL